MRVLLIASGVGLSHAARLLLIGRALTERGHHAALASGHGAAPPGSTFERLPEVTVAGFDDNVYAAYTPELIEACIEAELAQIEREQPDVLVADFRPTAAISARLADIPFVAVVNGYMTGAFDPTYALQGEGAATSYLGRRMVAAQRRSLAAPFARAAKARGLRGMRALDDFLTGEVTLVADLPEFCPLHEPPAGYKYIGPLIWEPEGNVPDNLDPSRPLVYATAGNTGGGRFAELIVEGLGDGGYEVVLSTGGVLDPPAATPPNVHAARFVPASQVLRKAVAVVHCGGNGTTYQALGEGLPALVIPFTTDQRINAHLIKRHRLGIPLALEKVTGRHIAAGVDVVRDDPDLRTPLARFQELVRGSDAPAAAAAIIDTIRR